MATKITMYGAIARGDNEAAQVIVAADPSILEQYYLEDTWLHRAAMMGQTKIMEVLVSAGMPVDQLNRDKMRTPLDSAAGQGHYGACEWLFDHGADPNYGIGKQATPFFSAIFSKSLELVKLFVKRGANLNATFGDPKIDVISYAERYGTSEIVAFLRSGSSQQTA